MHVRQSDGTWTVYVKTIKGNFSLIEGIESESLAVKLSLAARVAYTLGQGDQLDILTAEMDKIK